MIRYTCIFAAALALILTSASCAPQSARPTAATVLPAQADGATEAIHHAALKWFDGYLAGPKIGELTPLAEAIVDRLAAGGNFYVAGDPAFCDEMHGRAGRFAGTQVFSGQRMEKNDVLVVGLLDPSSKAARYFSSAAVGQGPGNLNNTLCVHIASHNWPTVAKLAAMANAGRWKGGLHMLDTAAPAGQSWADVSCGQMATVAVAGALEAEMVAAATRKGRTLPILLSIWAPRADDFNAKIKGKTLIDEPKLKPIPGGKLAREYLSRCRDDVAAFLSTGQPAQVRQAARRIADCQHRGGTILTIVDGHILARGTIIPPALTNILVYGVFWQWTAPQGLTNKDTLLYVGYIDYPKDTVAATVKAGVGTIVMTVDEGPKDDGVTSIRTCWQKWDAAVEVPGYAAKAIPASAVVQTPQWYSLMAEAERLVKLRKPE